MLEAFSKDKSLGLLEAQLPKNVEQTKQELRGSLAEEPLNARALLILAHCHSLSDELDEARHALEKVIEHNPDHVTARTELAKIHFKQDHFGDAIRLLTDVTNASPEITENWRLLSEALQQDEQIEASQDALRQYDMIMAFNAKLQIAERAFAKSDFKRADEICRQLLQLVPNEVRTCRLLAKIARQFNHYEFSTSTLARYIATRPGDVALGLEYAYSLLGTRMYPEALVQCQRLIDVAPENIDIYDIKAEVLYNLGQYEEAIAIYRELSDVPEKAALSFLHLGKVLKTVGKAAEATVYYQQAIAVDPSSGQAYWEMADLKTYRFSDDEVASMRTLLDASDVSALDKVMVGFALGKALEDAQQFEESFEHYQTANSSYSHIRPSKFSSQNALFKSTFTAEYFSDRTESGNNSDAAIFVVGLPRSGTTLLEQILSSHSLIDGTQELDEITSIARAAGNRYESEQEQYPRSMDKLSAKQIQDFAQRYLDYAQPYRQSAPYFVDKAPHNFHHIGLIKTLFPNARIIDIRRNPMASGWSLYRQFFSDSFLFSYDLKAIGKYYNDYVELMDHWHAVLPKQILTLSYEDLVKDLPATVDSLLQYCGLAYEDACLSFHMNDRPVATPSAEQVRQPLYTDALEHWKNYDAFLSPLKQVLEDHDRSPTS